MTLSTVSEELDDVPAGGVNVAREDFEVDGLEAVEPGRPHDL
jgi:hypothetical protein